MVDVFAWMSAVRTALQYLHRGGQRKHGVLGKYTVGRVPHNSILEKKKGGKNYISIFFFLSVI